jgi:hypothetical protein
MYYLRYLCLFAYNGVQHILYCVFVLFSFVWCTYVTSFSGLLLRYSLTVYLFSFVWCTYVTSFSGLSFGILYPFICFPSSGVFYVASFSCPFYGSYQVK